MVAASSCKGEALRRLLDKGADVKVKDNNGVLALMKAAFSGCVVTTSLLR
jgi:ankyrin repeat protein